MRFLIIGLFLCLVFENLVSAFNPVPLGKYPYIVQFVREDPNSKTTFNCTGTIIHPRYVLTALSCLTDDETLPNINDTHIIYDTNRPHIASSQNYVDIEKFFITVSLENFTTGREDFTAKNNIAIIQVASEFPINNNVNTTILSSKTDPFKKSIPIFIVGFGGINRDGERNQLREYSDNVEDYESEIILLSLSNSKIRVGEIGSPLLIEDEGVLKQYGIASHNHQQSNGKFIPVFGKIGHHCDWIQKVTKNLVKCE
uniref:Peptidase S1 domain-containing protein n=1 Tax=Panagrolaimus sp. PS1159 TaxID=55785 RepID=A0AC35FBK9_9BILA